MIEVTTRYETLKYSQPVPVRGKILTENQFLVVSILGLESYLSVLPGFHETTLKELEFKIVKFFSSYKLDFSNIIFSRKFFNLVELDETLTGFNNEVLFNVESILLGMIKKTHPHLFNDTTPLINELYRQQNPATFYAETRCLKIKIHPRSVDTTIPQLKELHSINHDLLFRLDGNRFFELSEMIEFEKKLISSLGEEIINKIDYVEEPFKNYYDTINFHKRSRLRIALDESFTSLKNAVDEDQIVVVKPSLNGISTIYNWMETHTKNRMIISSAYEHPSVKIGLVFLAQFRPQEFHGLENLI